MIVQAVLFIITSILLFVLVQKIHAKLKRYPPGPIRWPLIGSIPQMMLIDSKYVHKQMFEMSKQYGPIMTVGFGMYFTVVVNSYEIMKDLFKRPETNQHRFRSDNAIQRSNGENLGVIWGSGHVWKQVKKVTIKGLKEFGFGKARSAEESYKEETDAFLEDIREEISITGGVWAVDPERVSIISINILWGSVGGYRFDHRGDIIKEHIRLSAELLTTFNPTSLLTAFPFLKIFPELSGYNRNCEIHKRVWAFMQGLINDAKTRRQGRVKSESFVEYFLDEVEKNKGNPESQMTENQLVVILMDLFLGGTDTVSAVTYWLFLYFALYRTVQEKARDEMREASNNWTQSIPVAESSRFPYLRACIYEAMRHSPFASFTVPRFLETDVECVGYKIPSGSCLHFNLYPVFHDELFWGEDVEEYIPERFLNADETKIIPKQYEQLAQFGFGSRICPGEALAMNTIAAVAVAVLSTYELRVVPGRETTLEPGKPSIPVLPKAYVLQLKDITRFKEKIKYEKLLE